MAHHLAADIRVICIPMVIDVGSIVDIIQANQKVVIRRLDMAWLVFELWQIAALYCVHKNLIQLFLPGTLTNQLVKSIALVKKLLTFFEQLNAFAIQCRQCVRVLNSSFAIPLDGFDDGFHAIHSFADFA